MTPSFPMGLPAFSRLKPNPDVKLVRLIKLATRRSTLVSVSRNLSFLLLRLLLDMLRMGITMCWMLALIVLGPRWRILGTITPARDTKIRE